MDLQSHIETVHVENINQMYECKICDKEFVQEEILKLHNETCHTTNVDFQCQHCDETFPTNDNLLNHMEEHHERGLLEKTFFNPSASH